MTLRSVGRVSRHRARRQRRSRRHRHRVLCVRVHGRARAGRDRARGGRAVRGGPSSSSSTDWALCASATSALPSSRLMRIARPRSTRAATSSSSSSGASRSGSSSTTRTARASGWENSGNGKREQEAKFLATRGTRRRQPAWFWESDCDELGAERPVRSEHRVSAHLGHRPVQLPLPVLHARAKGCSGCRRREILSYEEIADVVRQLAPLGLRRLRITGGEPTIRPDLDDAHSHAARRSRDRGHRALDERRAAAGAGAGVCARRGSIA